MESAAFFIEAITWINIGLGIESAKLNHNNAKVRKRKKKKKVGPVSNPNKKRAQESENKKYYAIQLSW
jgi:hypothetical protein